MEAVTQIEVDFRIPAWLKEKPKEDTAPIPVGPGVRPPLIVMRVEPRYTDEARAAKYTGTVVVSGTVHIDGTLTVDEVLRDLDYGLTKNAIEALEQWKFKPGVKEGKAVPVSLKIEVNFNLKDDQPIRLR